MLKDHKKHLNTALEKFDMASKLKKVPLRKVKVKEEKKQDVVH